MALSVALKPRISNCKRFYQYTFVKDRVGRVILSSVYLWFFSVACI